MPYTITTRNSSDANRDHNIRNPNTVEKETHIDPNGIYEIWIDERPEDAYKRLFGEAVNEYNKSQTRADRMIRNYLSHVRGHAKRNPVYEMVIQVGNMRNQPDPDVGREIMLEFVEDWKNRNPNLEMIGAYYHADEETPHVHIDYIPVAHGYKNGPETQPGIVRAYEEMGFKTVSRSHKRGGTAQIKWEKRENAYLEQLCRVHGYEIEHPSIEGVKHLDTDLYKKVQELKHTEIKLEQVRLEKDSAIQEQQVLSQNLIRLRREADDLKARRDKMFSDLSAYDRLRDRHYQLQDDYKSLREFCSKYSVNDRSLLEIYDEQREREGAGRERGKEMSVAG